MKNQTTKLISDLLPLLETALAVDHQPERVEAFVDGLEDLSELQIKHAFKRAVKSWRPNYGAKFPCPAELREYAEELDGPMQQVAAQSIEIDPEKLPKGWTEQEWKRAKLTLQVKRANANRHEPDENPHETRKDHATRLIAAMRAALKAGALQMPSDVLTYEQQAELRARARLGPSEIPEKPEDRAPWARQKAKDMGWTQ